jgi:hypothetical protein
VPTAALGQSRPKWAFRAMSGLPPIATELRTSWEVRLVPIGDIAQMEFLIYWRLHS